MKRLLSLGEEEEEWEIQPFLLDIITPYIGETVMTFGDFIEWHCTCKTVWRHLDSLLYGEYMRQFLVGCHKRNFKLYTQFPQIITYRRLALLTTLIRVCRLLPNIVSLMKTAVVDFDYSPITIAGDLSQLGYTGPNLTRIQDIDTLNLMHHYIKEKFGWSFVIFNTTMKELAKMPLSLTLPLYGPTHEYNMALTPGLTNKPLRLELSICHSK